MLFILGSVILHIYNQWKCQKVDEDDNMNKMLIDCLRNGLREHCSFIIREAGSILSDGSSRSNYWRASCVAACMERVVLEKNGKQLLQSDPQIKIELKEWTSYISKQDYPVIQDTVPDGKCFLLVTAVTNDGQMKRNTDNIMKVTDNLKPIAWKSGDVFGIIGECSEQEAEKLASAFLDGRLELGEEPLHLTEICSVGVEGHAANLLRTGSSSQLTPFPSANDINPFQKQYFDGPTEVVGEELCNDGIGTQRCDEDDEMYDDFSQGIDGMGDCDEGAGEAMFSMGESSIQEDVGSGCTSIEGSPSKTGYGFVEGGAGEALSPSIEDRRLFAPFRKSNNKSKPPNVLIYCGKKDSQRMFEILKGVFSLCLNSERYVIYHLKHEHVMTVPWVDNAAALIISYDRLYDGAQEKFLEYFQHGGTVISFASNFDSLFTDKERQENYSGVLNVFYGSQKEPLMSICGMFHYTRELNSKLEGIEMRSIGEDSEGRDVILEAVHESSGGIAILSQCNLDKDPSEMAITSDIYSMLKQANPRRFSVLRELFGNLGLDTTPGAPLPLTPCVLLAVNQVNKDTLYSSLSKRLKDGILTTSQLKLQFVETLNKVDTVIKRDVIPVIVGSQSCSFNMEEYKKHLNTKLLGNTVVYSDVTTSTMNIIDAMTYSVPEGVGLIAIARSQTLGKGRGGNAWISPIGCAMFSLRLKILLSSELGQRMSYIQHIASLAAVQAITSLPGYHDFPLQLKWPNDIYYENKIKLGGVIVNSSVMGNTIHINIGCGVNISNQNPTTCVNELIQMYNRSHDTELATLTSEQFIANTVTQIAKIVDIFQSEGVDAFLNLYYKKWLHSDKMVEIHGHTGEARVEGLDDYGYLKVHLADGTYTSVHPDGNSYDIMKNLIIPKS